VAGGHTGDLVPWGGCAVSCLPDPEARVRENGSGKAVNFPGPACG
jgi:hypothetical protein